MLKTESSQWLQQIVDANVSHVILELPGLAFPLLRGSRLSSALPSAAHRKSLGMFDALAAPAVYPIFNVAKHSEQSPYNAHDSFELLDSNYKPLPKPSSQSLVDSLGVRYSAALRVRRKSGKELPRDSPVACPAVVPVKPVAFASSTIGVQPQRHPKLRSCHSRDLDDGSTATFWSSEVQLSNHLSMPFVVSDIVFIFERQAYCFFLPLFDKQPSMDALDALELGSVTMLSYR
jgi:hypothetical protein